MEIKISYMRDARGENITHFGVVLENLFDLSQPTHVQHIGEIGPLCLTGSTNETTVFGRHTESFDVTQVLCQEVSVTAGDDVDQILGIFAQSFERLKSGI
jgi:hypothetical protein